MPIVVKKFEFVQIMFLVLNLVKNFEKSVLELFQRDLNACLNKAPDFN